MIPETYRVIDLSRPLVTGMPVWPGDTPFSLKQVASLAGGDSCTVGAMATSLHNGTHVDAPSHFLRDGPAIDDLDLTTFVGPAQVAAVPAAGLILPEHLGEIRAPRLLLRTDCWSPSGPFPCRIPTLHPDVPALLAERGVRLLGVDVPSVDPISSSRLEMHWALQARRIAILESLNLSGVRPGNYVLIALPLRIAQGDASPVRAILIEGDAPA